MRILHPEFRDYFGPTKHPFADISTLVNRDGIFVPVGVFLDASIYLVGGQPPFYISYLDITQQGAKIWIGDSKQERLASTEFSFTSLPDTLPLQDSYERPAGIFVSEPSRLSIFQSLPVGEHAFRSSQTQFSATCTIPLPDIGVRGFVLDDGTVISGNVWFVGEDGVVLTPETRSVEVTPGELSEETVLRIDVVGDPLFRRKLCGGLFTTPQFLQSVIVQSGACEVELHSDVAGNIQITIGDHEVDDPVLRMRSSSSLIFEAAGEKIADG